MLQTWSYNEYINQVEIAGSTPLQFEIYAFYLCLSHWRSTTRTHMIFVFYAQLLQVHRLFLLTNQIAKLVIAISNFITYSILNANINLQKWISHKQKKEKTKTNKTHWQNNYIIIIKQFWICAQRWINWSGWKKCDQSVRSNYCYYMRWCDVLCECYVTGNRSLFTDVMRQSSMLITINNRRRRRRQSPAGMCEWK